MFCPNPSILERDEAVDTKHSGKRAQVSIQQKVVNPMFDTRPGTQIIIELGKHLGVEKYFNFDIDEANRLRLKPFGSHPRRAEAKGSPFCGREVEGRFQ